MTHRDRRALALGSVVVLAALLLLRVAPRIWGEVARIRQEVSHDAERLARMRAELGEAKALEDSGRAIQPRLTALASRLVTGGREAEAQADLGSRVEAAVSRNRVRLTRAEPAADSASAGALRRVSVAVSIQGDNAGLLGVLAALAADSAALVVREITILAENPRSGGGRAEVLNGELVVGGWYVVGKQP